ncbi:hypothetical protein E4T48_04210 [Aureobasidium sp. EXF-10727]|nr:hypothetical protein E4T48_04210 [Aureobasidium sp. EXF-10727]
MHNAQLSAKTCGHRVSPSGTPTTPNVVAPAARRSTPMPPLFTNQQCSEARHLLRAILREATYLPDHQARIYIASHAVARFRHYAPAHKSDDVLKDRRREQLTRARKGLSELHRANQGELKPLLKVLHLTYARIGKRRHEILRGLQHKPPADADLKPDALPKLTPQHIALLDSQKLASPPNIVRPLLRSWSLKIPDTNSWEKPLPKKRIAKIVRDWYANVLERTVVPLPVSEWERLRDLALGKIKFQGPLPRRPMSASGSSLPSPLELALGLVQLNAPDVVINNVTNSFNARRLTARSMRRCWATVFAQCPVMSWNADSEKWSVQWGCNVLDQARIANATDELVLDKT